MKKLLIICLLLIGVAGFSQQYRRDYNSRYRVNYSPGTVRGQVLDISSMKINPVYEQPNSQITGGSQASSVYVSNRGKQYVYVTSKKTGNVYKKYIK